LIFFESQLNILIKKKGKLTLPKKKNEGLILSLFWLKKSFVFCLNEEKTDNLIKKNGKYLIFIYLFSIFSLYRRDFRGPKFKGIIFYRQSEIIVKIFVHIIMRFHV
jgi:hypothetical protein